MSDAPDPLEAELSSLRPHELSPALRRRVGERLAEPARRRWLWRVTLAGGLAAACLIAILLWREQVRRRVEPEPIVIRPRSAPPAKFEDGTPTLLTYRRVLAHSPDEPDGLLDMYPPAVADSGSDLVRIRAFTRSPAELHALLGDD